MSTDGSARTRRRTLSGMPAGETSGRIRTHAAPYSANYLQGYAHDLLHRRQQCSILVTTLFEEMSEYCVRSGQG